MRPVLLLVAVVATFSLAQAPAPQCATRCNTQASDCMKACANTTRELPSNERGAAMVKCVKSCEDANRQCKASCS